MKIRFQSMHVPCEFDAMQLNAVCYAIERFGDGCHPQPNAETISDFGFRYVLRCTAKLATSTSHESVWTIAAFEALDKIKNAVNHNRAVRKFTDEGFKEMIT